MAQLKISKIIVTLLMGLLSLVFLSPLLWMLSAASKIEKDVMKFPVQWIPTDWNLINNFQTVWYGKVPFGHYYMNSIKIALITTALTLIFSSMAGFSFAKMKFRYKNVVFFMLLTFFMIPAESTLVPRYVLIKWLGLYNTHAALIVMTAFSIPLTFLMRQFMLGINQEFIEAGKIDGAGLFRIYWQIVLPMAKPILATAGILKFMWSWNDYQNPLIFLVDSKLYTVPLGIQSFQGMYSTSYAAIMMAAVSAILPLLLVFIILQKQVIKGIAVGGVKG